MLCGPVLLGLLLVVALPSASGAFVANLRADADGLQASASVEQCSTRSKPMLYTVVIRFMVDGKPHSTSQMLQGCSSAAWAVPLVLPRHVEVTEVYGELFQGSPHGAAKARFPETGFAPPFTVQLPFQLGERFVPAVGLSGLMLFFGLRARLTDPLRRAGIRDFSSHERPDR